MKKNIVTIIAAAALMSSCGLYNKYERPAVETQNIMRDAAQMATTGDESFGDVDWHEVFTDPQLQALIQQALDHNIDLLNAADNVTIAEAQLKSARLAYLPSFAFTPSGTLSKVFDMGADMSKTYQLPITASWNTGLWGELASANRSAKAGYMMSQDYQQATRSRIICGVANTYYTLLLQDKNLEILNETETLLKEMHTIMKAQRDLGRVKNPDVLSAEASVNSLIASKKDLERQIHSVENSLSLLIGQAAGSISRGKFDNQQLPETFSLGVADSVLANRPDVHAAEMSLAQCFYGVQQSRQAFYPGLSFTATGAFSNSLGSMVVNPGKFLFSAVGSLVQPIFQNGKLIAGLKASKAQYDQAYRTWEHTLLTAGSEVSNALIDYNSYAEQEALDKQIVETNETILKQVTELYKMSSGYNYLSVISAQNDLLSAKRDLVSTQMGKMQAVVSLYSALGGGRK